MKRIQEQGAKCLPLVVNEMSVFSVNDHKLFNRLVAQTNFDFDNVLQLMHSEPVAYPHKDGF